MTLVGCSEQPKEYPAPTLTRDLAEYVFARGSELPSEDDSGRIRVNAIYQDVQRTIDPSSEVLMQNRGLWVVVALCAPQSQSGEVITELEASLIPEELLTDNVRDRANQGEFFAPLNCKDGWTKVPAQ